MDAATTSDQYYTEEAPSYYIRPNHAKTLASTLFNLYKEGIGSDIDVICGDQTFHLHSAVLIHGSEYFQRILASGNQTSKKAEEQQDDGDDIGFELPTSTSPSPKTRCITLEFNPPIDPSTFDIVIDSLYTGIVHNMTELNITSLLSAYHHLQIHYAHTTCVNYMLRHLQIDNCLTYWLAGKYCDSTRVQNKAIGLMGRHLHTFYTSHEFLELQAYTIMEILNQDGLQVPNEQIVFEAAMAWIKFDEDVRSAEISNMLDVIRLTYLPAFYLVNVVGKEDLIENDVNAFAKYSSALKLKLADKHNENMKQRHNSLYGTIGQFEQVKKQSKESNCLADCKGRIISSFERQRNKSRDGVDGDDVGDELMNQLEFEEEENEHLNSNSRGLLESTEDNTSTSLSSFVQGFLDIFQAPKVQEDILVVCTNDDEGDDQEDNPAEESSANNDSEEDLVDSSEKKNFFQSFFSSFKTNITDALKSSDQGNEEEESEELPTDVTDDTANSSENEGFQENFTISYKRLEGVPEENDEDLSEAPSRMESQGDTGISYSNEDILKENDDHNQLLQLDMDTPMVGGEKEDDMLKKINVEIPQDIGVPKTKTDNDSYC